MSNKNRYMSNKSISIKFFQPSWFLIKTDSKIIYIDPAYLSKYYTKYPKKIDFTKWPDPIDGLPDRDLEKADLILITHHHKDHCKVVAVNRLKKTDTLILAPKVCIKELGDNIKITKPGDKINVGEIEIETTFAYNTEQGSSTKKVHYKGECVGFLICINGRRIYHAGDTDFIPEMKNLGKVDVALLPIGGTYTMNIKEAVQAADTIKPKVAIPMHNMKASLNEFKHKTEALGTKVVILRIGEVYKLE